ncbi:MAG: hypothetical protein DDG60_16745, partial [Anaerolineae bacterium]
MSKVALRVYNRDIEALIDQGHYDEAIAHCQHVLKTFPKYLEIYRLLGKAYLEARRFAEAADIFLRVLLAVPDDFVSHLAMSIIYDEQKDLDRAIWHMERAYEVYPSNAGVQNELRRLYGRRDGLEPPKIRLTRGALAQMYTKGGQYQQAIVEIKSVLTEDPTRLDLKTLLARAYFRAGMKVEATEICTELLRQYPYHLDANRILVEILPGTSLAGNVEQYKKRVHALDPYAAFVSGSLFQSENVPDNAVSIDRLEYDAFGQGTTWQQSVQPVAAPSIQPSTENLPDWMKQAGWGPSTGEFQEGPVEFEEPQASPVQSSSVEIAQAEIPDWLKAMAPPSADQSQPQEESSAIEDLDWLAGLGAPLSTSTSPEPISSPDIVSQPASDWLSDLAPAASSTPSAEEDLDWLAGLGVPSQDVPGQAQASLATDVPDWLNNLETPISSADAVNPPVTTSSAQDVPDWLSGSEPSASSGDELPDWLSGVSQPAATESPVSSASLSTPSAGPTWLDDLPSQRIESTSQPEATSDWLTGFSAAAQPASAPVSGPGTSADEQDEALKWLESLAARQGAKPEELLTRPEERREELPDWLAGVGEEPAAGQPAVVSGVSQEAGL